VQYKTFKYVLSWATPSLVLKANILVETPSGLIEFVLFSRRCI
jgi:hypothetical protein